MSVQELRLAGSLVKRAKGDCTCARAGFPDSCDNCDGGTIMSEWQTIETAPKSHEVIISGRYPNGRPYVETAYWDPRGFWSGRRLDPPTHWMPLPAPPAAE